VTNSAPLMTLAIRGHISPLKSTSGAHKFIILRSQMSMKLHSKLGNFLRIKTKVL